MSIPIYQKAYVKACLLVYLSNILMILNLETHRTKRNLKILTFEKLVDIIFGKFKQEL